MMFFYAFISLYSIYSVICVSLIFCGDETIKRIEPVLVGLDQSLDNHRVVWLSLSFILLIATIYSWLNWL